MVIIVHVEWTYIEKSSQAQPEKSEWVEFKVWQEGEAQHLQKALLSWMNFLVIEAAGEGSNALV